METNTLEIPVKPPRRFLPDNLTIDSWKKVENFFLDLKKRQINSVLELENWLLDWSELDAVFSEDAAWRYIRMTCDTTNKEYVNSYNFFIEEIEPSFSTYNNEFNKKLITTPFLKQLDDEKYRIFLRNVKKESEIFREENIPLITEQSLESQKFGAVSAAQTIKYKNQELTIQQATKFLKDTERGVREEVWKLVKDRKLKDVTELHDLFTRLISIRNKIALNAGFKNYRDYKFKSLGRFDYKVEDCFSFHDSIQKVVVPILSEFDNERKETLKLNSIKPWDTDVDITGKEPLKPFVNGKELIEKSIACFYKVRSYYGECLEVMHLMKHLDLESRIGKAPGGYNYPLYEIGVPFIFMNSVGTHRDLVTMVHEGGHAVHSFLSRNLEITDFKNVPSEIAELASMSMELISMEHWDIFFSNKDDLKRAKKEQLEKVLRTLPWIAMIDKFQHWVYENPNHTITQRTEEWNKLMSEFQGSSIDWTGFEDYVARLWQNQLHLFEVPFYYIEYGFAQLGAIAVWRNYKTNPEKALDEYQKALSLGYTKSIPEIYKAAGIKFDFSHEYVNELISFVRSELHKIN